MRVRPIFGRVSANLQKKEELEAGQWGLVEMD